MQEKNEQELEAIVHSQSKPTAYHPRLLYGIEQQEYEDLKKDEHQIIENVKKSINDSNRSMFFPPRIENVKVTFKYNQPLNVIGIYLIRDENEVLILNEMDSVEGMKISSGEREVIMKLYFTLEKRLERIRLGEDWI